jgi:hypothetical protein
MEELREAVLDKNMHWNNRYRARDGNDVWGGRSTLAFVDDQTNAEVLQHELTMLDVMTANRDERVWARAKGEDKEIDDSNVPASRSRSSPMSAARARAPTPKKKGRSLHQRRGGHPIHGLGDSL